VLMKEMCGVWRTPLDRKLLIVVEQHGASLDESAEGAPPSGICPVLLDMYALRGGERVGMSVAAFRRGASLHISPAGRGRAASPYQSPLVVVELEGWSERGASLHISPSCGASPRMPGSGPFFEMERIGCAAEGASLHISLPPDFAARPDLPPSRSRRTADLASRSDRRGAWDLLGCLLSVSVGPSSMMEFVGPSSMMEFVGPSSMMEFVGRVIPS
jgi:hypothetical protein